MGLICSSYGNLHTAIPLNNGVIKVNYNESSSEVIFQDDSGSTILAENVNEVKASAIIEDFFKRLNANDASSKEGQSVNRKFSTWKVVVTCLIGIVISLYFSWPDKPLDTSNVLAQPYEGLQSTGSSVDLHHDSEPEELIMSAELADTILKADISKVKSDEISKGMAQINKLALEMSEMSKEQRLNFIKRSDVQELLSKKWAIDLAE